MTHRLKAMCHTDASPCSAREIASMALPAEQERHTESRRHIALRRGSTSSLSHSHEPYGAASVAPMRFCCVLSLLLSVGSIPALHLKFLNNFSGQRFDGKIQEKRSGKRNRDTFATVIFLFRSVTPVPRKLDQTILFLSLSHL